MHNIKKCLLCAQNMANQIDFQVIATLTLLHDYDNVTKDIIGQLESTFNFGESKNSEILFA